MERSGTYDFRDPRRHAHAGPSLKPSFSPSDKRATNSVDLVRQFMFYNPFETRRSELASFSPGMASILIVDDDRATRVGVAELLEDAGYGVIAVATFEELCDADSRRPVVVNDQNRSHAWTE